MWVLVHQPLIECIGRDGNPYQTPPTQVIDTTNTQTLWGTVGDFSTMILLQMFVLSGTFYNSTIRLLEATSSPVVLVLQQVMLWSHDALFLALFVMWRTLLPYAKALGNNRNLSMMYTRKSDTTVISTHHTDDI